MGGEKRGAVRETERQETGIEREEKKVKEEVFKMLMGVEWKSIRHRNFKIKFCIVQGPLF